MSRSVEKNSYTIRQENWAQKRKKMRNYTSSKSSEVAPATTKPEVLRSSRKFRSVPGSQSVAQSAPSNPSDPSDPSNSSNSSNSSNARNLQRLDEIEQRLKSLEGCIQQILEELLALKALKVVPQQTTIPKQNDQLESSLESELLESELLESELPESDTLDPVSNSNLSEPEDISDTEMEFILEEPESDATVTIKHKLQAPKLKTKDI